jgi:transcriptional regulator with XRE-family HTH domain
VSQKVDMVDKNLCDKLKTVRLNLTESNGGKVVNQTDFAKKIGISRSIIADIESYRREPSKKVIKKIAEIFNAEILSSNAIVEKPISRTEYLRERSLKTMSMIKKLNEFEKEVQELRDEIKKLESERDDWREQARFLKGLLEGKK